MMEKVAKESEQVSHEGLSRLRAVFPQFVAEGVIDFDALRAFFDAEGMLAGEEKYGLSWAGKGRAFQAIRTPSTGTLVPQADESKNFNNTENIFIEGDNLEVLKLLQKRYRERIKMVYIDPPYNTGHDFVYKDNFTQSIADYYEQTGQTEGGIRMTANTEKNGRFHSDWLTMMYPRLFLAKNLLRDDGVIFVSIDDNEVANLRLIMDEIFGEENFVAQIIVQLNPRGRTLDRFFAKTHEYVLVYIKNIELDAVYQIEKSTEQIAEYSKEDEFGKYRLLELRNRNPVFNRVNRPNLYYPIFVNPETNEISLTKSGVFTLGILPINSKSVDGCWTWGKKKVEENIENLVAKEANTRAWRIYRKDYLHGEDGGVATTKEKALWVESEINNERGKEVVRDLFGGDIFFDFPKSVELIKKCVNVGTKEGDVILDFFAGSGTTAHAVMDLNAEDGGNRKWICVQLPELTDEESEAHQAGYKTIADISRERIRRAGERALISCHSRVGGNPGLAISLDPRVKPEDDKTEIGKWDTGFKSYRLVPSNYRQWRELTEEDTPEALLRQSKLFVEHPLVDGYDERSVVYEIFVKEGFDLNASVSAPVAAKSESVRHSGEETRHIWIITDSMTDPEQPKKLVVTFADKVTQEYVGSLGLKPEDTFVCLDNALDDTTKINIARRVHLKVI